MVRVYAHAQGFVAAVLTDRLGGQLAGDQEGEAVRVLGSADAALSPGDDWQPVGIRRLLNSRGSGPPLIAVSAMRLIQSRRPERTGRRIAVWIHHANCRGRSAHAAAWVSVEQSRPVFLKGVSDVSIAV